MSEQYARGGHIPGSSVPVIVHPDECFVSAADAQAGRWRCSRPAHPTATSDCRQGEAMSMPLQDHTAAERETLARFEAAPFAPEADARARLDAVDAALKAATPGPWKTSVESDGVWLEAPDDYWPAEVYGDRRTDDAAAIVAAVNTAPALVAAVRAVLDLADELDGWRDNAFRYEASAPPGSVDAKAARARALAYRRSADSLRSVVSAALGQEP